MPVVKVENETHFQTILNENKIVIAKFSAKWCSPCRKIAPFYESLSLESNNMFVTIDVEKVPSLAEECDIKRIPAFIRFVSGTETRRYVGDKKEKLKLLCQV